MSNLITNKMRYYSSENFLQSITSADDYLYMFLAKSSKWPEGFGYEDPLVDSDVLDREVWKDILAMKRILPSDCFRVINAFSWVSGTLYDEYDDSKELDQLTFYVINNNNVYKCISNDRGKVSTIAPTGVDSGLLETTDGYIWKFMYGIPAGDDGNWSQWSITGWFPVSNIKTESENPEQWNVMDNASNIDGAIYNFRYTDVDQSNFSDLIAGQGSNITVEGDGTGFVGSFSGTPGLANTELMIKVTDPGLGYTYWSDVRVGDVSIKHWAEPILSPPGGHGSNPVAELDGFYIIVGSFFDDPKYFSGNEYRRIGIVSNPMRKFDSRGLANNKDKIVGNEFVYGERLKRSTVDTRIELTIATVNVSDPINLETLHEWLFDETNSDVTLVQGSDDIKGLVVTSDPENNKITIISEQEPSKFEISGDSVSITVGEVSYGANITAIKDAENIRYVGDILYVENLSSPIKRPREQFDKVKMVLEF